MSLWDELNAAARSASIEIEFWEDFERSVRVCRIIERMDEISRQIRVMKLKP